MNSNEILQVKQANGIVEAINDFLPLKKNGKDYWACCPFHEESTPSFSVVETKGEGFYKCFGCGANGDVISFIQEYEKKSFHEAIIYLAKKANIQLSTENEELAKESNLIIKALNSALELFKNDLGREQINYLKERGLNENQIKDFELGFAKDSFSHLQNSLMPKYSKDILLKAGLVIESKTNNMYFNDKYRNRIMIPIRNHLGVLVGFAGRYIGSDAKNAKYINSPET